ILKIIESDGEEETLDDPMEIDFVQKKEPATSVATIQSKRLGLKINTDEKHNLSGEATVPTTSIGTTSEVSINLIPGCSLRGKFVIVEHPKFLLAFSNPLLDKYNYDLLASKCELKVTCDGKDFFIPITVRKVKNKD
ncbi:12810_t:CDS:2, partial [Entrophospora sp. SA101]